MKNLSIFPIEKSKGVYWISPFINFMSIHHRNAKEENFSFSIFCFVSGHMKSNQFYTRLKG